MFAGHLHTINVCTNYMLRIVCKWQHGLLRFTCSQYSRASMRRRKKREKETLVQFFGPRSSIPTYKWNIRKRRSNSCLWSLRVSPYAKYFSLDMHKAQLRGRRRCRGWIYYTYAQSANTSMWVEKRVHCYLPYLANRQYEIRSFVYG